MISIVFDNFYKMSGVYNYEMELFGMFGFIMDQIEIISTKRSILLTSIPERTQSYEINGRTIHAIHNSRWLCITVYDENQYGIPLTRDMKTKLVIDNRRGDNIVCLTCHAIGDFLINWHSFAEKVIDEIKFTTTGMTCKGCYYHGVGHVDIQKVHYHSCEQ